MQTDTSLRSSPPPDRPNELRRLAALHEIGQALAGTSSLRTGLQHALEILCRQPHVARAMVALVDESSGELRVEASDSCGAGRASLGVRYKPGEGVVGQVLQSGRPVVVPRVSCEPALLNRAADRRSAGRAGGELTFVCVPLLVQRQVVGVLGVDLEYRAERKYERSRQFYSIVASMLAQGVRTQRAVRAERQRLTSETAQLREELRDRYDFAGMLGASSPMRQVHADVVRVARTSTTVLVRGESGTGKELVARAIHFNSPRRKKPFVKVSCAALPETLIESELFGYEPGAFTGAQGRKKGRFELAEGGTLFLDEIGELNLSIQVKLLRVLQEREFERLGGTETLQANVRLIAATNRDLEAAITAGAFREDLYYRLNVFTVFVPPLRDRKPDVPLLADHFLERLSAQHGRRIRRLSTPAIDMLMSYHWPGNVRELQNALERAVLICDGDVVHAHHLPPTLQTAKSSNTVMTLSLEEAMAAYERDLIQDALKTTSGMRARAARLLHTTARVFNYKVRKHGIDWRRFRQK